MLAGGCSSAQLPGLDDGILTPRVDELHPAIVLPSSRIDLLGANFADPARASTRLALTGSFTPTGGDTTHVSLQLAAQEVDETHAFAVASGAWQDKFGVAGSFDGNVVVQSVSALDGSVKESLPSHVAFAVATTLQPKLSSVSGGSIHVNDAVVLKGDGFLLGTGEGETRVVVDGCFAPAGATVGASCAGGVAVKNVELTTKPLVDAPWDRTQVAFAFSPAIAGIKPGSFSGTILVRNVFASSEVKPAGTMPLAATILKPEVTAVAPTTASLGQYVDIMGGGFVGEAADEVTLLHLVGKFMPDAGGPGANADLTLVAYWSGGNDLRYVLDEADALGRLIDLRRISGKFVGQITPIARKGNDEVVGAAKDITLAIAPMRQVVYIRFLPSYVDSLRLYGLAAADAEIRKRILAVAKRDYAGVNVEFRAKPPTDFALYSRVDVEGPDPNALGLLGYDNTPGKDVGNQRLFDSIGGVNATTQSDGFPGYGGIFAENFLGFSAHPSPRVMRLETDPTDFDAIFDAVRPDTGVPVTASDLRGGLLALTDGGACLAKSRSRELEVSCAVFVLGSLVGTTLTHEVGHSLGLADPTGEAFHDPGDGPNRLMDAGGARPFEERAELMGLGPAVFCDGEYSYLKTVLPSTDASGGDAVQRPDCN